LLGYIVNCRLTRQLEAKDKELLNKDQLLQIKDQQIHHWRGKWETVCAELHRWDPVRQALEAVLTAKR
jgi:hypothetical protein